MSVAAETRVEIDSAEVLFLIAQYLRHCTPLSDAADLLIRDINARQLLPDRIDWLGAPHRCSVDDLARRYSHVDTARRLPALLQEVLLRTRAPSLLADIASQAAVARAARPLDLAAAIRGRDRRAMPYVYSQLSRIKTFCGHGHPVYCVTFDNVGARVITGSDDTNVKVWSVTSGALLGVLRGHKSYITDTSVSPDNQLVAAGAVDGSIRVWQLDTFAPVAVLLGHKTSITSVAFSPCGRFLLSSAVGCVARVWRTDADFEALPTLFYDQIVQRPRLTRTLSNAIDAAALMHASLFGAGAVRAPQPAAAAAAAAAFGPESMHTREPPVDDPPVASNTPAIALFGLAGCVFAMVGYPAEVASSAATAIAVDDDSSSSSSEPIVGIAQRRRDRLAAAAAASARERAAAVAAAPRKKIVIRLFNIDVLSCVCELVGHSDEISTMRFPSNPTRAQLCSGSDDGTVRVWSFGDVFRADAPAKRTGASVGWRVVCMEGAARAAGRVNSVVWAVDDQRVVAVHEDCVLRVWDAHSGALRHELRHHTDDVFALTANPGDSTVVLSGGHDGSVAVWDVLNGVLLKEIRLASDMPAGNRVLDGSFAAAGDMLVVSNFYGEAMLFGFGAQPQQLLNRYPTEQFLPDESQPLLYDNFGWCVDAQTRVPPHLMARRALIDFAGAGHDAAVFDVGTPAPFVATAAHRRRIAERQAARSTAAACVRRDFPGLWAGAEYSLVDATPPPAPRWTLQNTPSGNVGLRVPPNRSAPAAAANARNNNARAAQALRARSRGRPRRSDHAPVVFLPTPPTSDDDDSPDDGDGGGGFDDEEYHGVDESESDVPDDADDDDDDDSAATRRRRRRARAEAAQVARQFAVRELPQRAARSSARSYRIDADEDGDDDDASADTRPARRRRVGGGDDEDEFNIDGAPSSVDEDEVDGVRYPDWMQLAVPPAAPGAYFPQVGDVVVYFPQGHYDVIAKYRWRQPADMPVWVTAPHFPSAVLCTVMECVSGRDDPVFFIDVLLRPCATEPGALPLTRSTMRAAVSEAAASGKAAAAVSSTSTVPAVAPPTENFVVRHVPMAEFECLVPRAFVERALRTPWADGTRVRSYLHDTKSWMTGAVLSIAQDVMRPAVRATVNSNESVWRSVQVQWDGTNAIENVSPWELEPATPDDAPPPPPSDDEPPRDASPEALRLLMLRAHGEPRGDDIGECEWLVNQRARMLHAFDVVCSAEVARIFLDPVDLSEYRKYALYVTAPMCVRLIRDRIANMWYRRRRAIVDDMDKLVVASCVFNSESHELTQRAAVVRQMCFAALDIITPTIDYDADSLPLVVPALALAATRRFDECQTTRAVTKSIVERAFATNEELAAAFPERYKLNILNRPRNRTVPRSSAATLPQSSSSQRRDERRHERNHVISSPSGVRPRRAAASAALAHGFGDRDDDGSPPPPRDHSTSGRRIRIPVRLHPGDGATATVPSPASQQQRLSLRDETRAQFAARTRPTNVIRISRSALAAGAAAASSGAPPAAAATSSTATAAAAATAALAIPVTRTRSVWNEDAQLAWALQQSLNEAGSSKRATRAASSQQPEANVTAVVDDDDDDDDKQKSKKSKKSKKAKSNVVVVDDDEEEDDDSEGFVPTPKKKPTSQRRQVDSDEESFGANADDDDDDDDDDEESEEEAVSSGRSKSRSKRATARTRRNYSLDDDVSGTVSSEDSADTRPKRGRGRPRKLPVAAAPTSDGPAKRRKKAKKDDSDDDDDDDESGGVSKRKARRTALVARRKVRQRSRANDGSDDFEPD